MTARAPARPDAAIAGVALSHADREFWPGISKRDLAEYWLALAGVALPEIARRPLAILRCPDGIGGAHFFQKHRHQLSPLIRDGMAGEAPYLAIDDRAGLVAMVQSAAIELHGWGATEADPLHPERLVFDLDPAEDVAFPVVVAAAHELRERLRGAGLESFCRTTGGKGLHLVVPILPGPGWEAVRGFCRDFAERLASDFPDRYVATLSKARRQGRILVDWLRNGLGATAVLSYSPRARDGATVATPLRWDEVIPGLDPHDFTLRSVPARVAGLRAAPWAGFDAARHALPVAAAAPPKRRGSGRRK